MKSSSLILYFFLGLSIGYAQERLDAPPYNEDFVMDRNNLANSLYTQLVLHKPLILDPDEEWRTWTTVNNWAFGKDRGNLVMITDLNSLHPFFRDKVIELKSRCASLGIHLAIVETYRTRAKQTEYKSMGQKYTRSAGGISKHQYGLAADVVPLQDSVADWDDARLWQKVGQVGEQLGLRWGGRWQHPYDPGHFEWTGGLSSQHLIAGILPKPPQPNNYPCLADDVLQLTAFWRAWEAQQLRTQPVLQLTQSK
jgi:hypothetical protein